MSRTVEPCGQLVRVADDRCATCGWEAETHRDPTFREPPRYIASSIRTAQSIAHRRLGELGDGGHAGEPALCQRPLCTRLRADAEAVEALGDD